MTDEIQTLPANAVIMPASFGRAMAQQGGINAGAVAIESERAIAEAQGQLTLAKRFPRSMTAAISDFLEACSSPSFAATAFYSVPNRGSGPSIRLAEEAARCYGNFVYGHRELSRSEGKSEIEVYAWDMEKNNRSSRQITVMHVVDTKNGPKKLIDQADIDNKIANVASKQMRGRILALMPKHMIASGIDQCKKTLAGGAEQPVTERILAMSKAFSRFGVTTTHLTAYLGHAVDDTTTDELADLTGIYNAIREGTAKASEFFKLAGDDESHQQASSTAAAITQRAKAGAAAKPATNQMDSAQQEVAQKSESRKTATETRGEVSAAKNVTASKPESTATTALQPKPPADVSPENDDDVF